MEPKSRIYQCHSLCSYVSRFAKTENLLFVGLIDNFTPSKTIVSLNSQAPVAQKTADEEVFRHFQGEGVEFF